MVDDNLKLFKE